MTRALVTGGSAGIGLAICRAFLDANYDVVSLDRHPSPLQHVRLHTILVDLSDEAATEQAAREATREPNTTLVHNAGMISRSKAACRTTPAVANCRWGRPARPEAISDWWRRCGNCLVKPAVARWPMRAMLW